MQAICSIGFSRVSTWMSVVVVLGGTRGKYGLGRLERGKMVRVEGVEWGPSKQVLLSRSSKCFLTSMCTIETGQVKPPQKKRQAGEMGEKEGRG